MKPAAALAARAVAWGHRAENGLLVAAFLLAIALPVVEAAGRPLGGLHIPGSTVYLQQLILWLTFVGGLIAARDGGHLTLSTAEFLPEGGTARRLAAGFTAAVAAAVTAVVAHGALQVVFANRQGGERLGLGIPTWWSELVMPVGLALIAVRLAWRGGKAWRARAVAFAAIAAVFAFALAGGELSGPLLWALIGVVLAAVVLGAPVFTGMAGIGLLLFFADGTPVSAVPAEIYRLIASPTLPAIPLLTACGYLLAESRAADRLVRFFRALFGWLPGGIAVLVAGVCALFTTFTGGSGITILALGGLVYPILREEGYSERFSLGLVTTGGSLGLLFPPSLPVILFAVVASAPADQLFLAGFLPGLLLVALTAAYGVVVGRREQRTKHPFSWHELAHASWAAKWELSVPLLIVGLFASGVASMVEAAAAGALYALLIECAITREIHPWRDLPRVLVKGGRLVGGVLVLLASAMGLTSWLVDAQVPDSLLAFVQANVDSRIVFLLALNVFLLVLG
ncbi:MAG TPA: TRAP transporter large permease subunit, partial [Thermoanaerobaculia bacterium]|nr:TRAP transporter large permease subunit [Thermoanaerobaculia bacterium]